MGQIRDAGRTRQRILDAAADAVCRLGSNVSLDVIAREAEVSKGGLMHHFPTRERLVLALVEGLYGDFEAAVTAAVPQDDDAPGRFARAYIRVSFAGIEPAEDVSNSHLLLAQLIGVPAVRRYLEEEDTRWRAALVEDGLDSRMARIIIAATEGAATEGFELVDTEGLQLLERDLLALTRVAPDVMAILDADITDPVRP